MTRQHCMHTYLLTWNPDRWPWDDLAECAAKTAAGEAVEHRWSAGNTKRIALGDRVFLHRQGKELRGIIASGHAVSRVTQQPHWNPKKAQAGDCGLFVTARFDTILDPDQVRPLDANAGESSPLRRVNWDPPASGISINEEAAAEL